MPEAEGGGRAAQAWLAVPQAKGLPSAGPLCPERAIPATHPDRPPSQGHCSQVTCKGSFQLRLGWGTPIPWPPVISPAPPNTCLVGKDKFQSNPAQTMMGNGENAVLPSFPLPTRPKQGR